MSFERKKLASALANLALGAGVVVAGVPVHAQDIRVNVTGSSIPRAQTEGALPVTVLTREDIQNTGALNNEQLIQMISATSQLGGTVLATGAGTSTYGQSSASLRGLGTERTLVLVNGRRVSNFAGDTNSGVNVNLIPLAAVERLEVLRDGASSVYGSDAIAGVINFILVKDYTGVEASVTYGQPTRSGGGESTQANAVAGWGTLEKDRFNVTVSIAYQNDKALFAKDRNFAKTGNVFPWLVAGATGQGNIEGAFTPGTGSAAAGTWKEGAPVAGQFGTSPGTGFGNPMAAANNCGAINMFRNPTNTNKGAPFCAFDSSAFVGLLPDREAYEGSASFIFKINNEMQFFAEGLYGHQKTTQEIQPSPARRSFMQSDALFKQNGIDPALLINPANPNYKIAADYLNSIGRGALVGGPLAITARVFDFGNRTSEDESDQWRVVAGLRGTWRAQDWEFAYYHNENKVEGSVIAGYFSQTAYAKLIQTSNDWNPWSLTQTDSFNAKLPAAAYIGPTLDAKTTSDAVDGKITGEAWKLPAGPMQYAAGFQWATTDLNTQPSPALGTGDIAGLGGSVPPVNESRDVWGIYGEFNIPIVKSLDASVQGRYDDYSDVGNKFNWWASLRWQPAKEVLLRTAYGTGFRAPTLFDLWYPVTLGTSEQFNDPATGQTNLQVNNLAGGNPNLKPETSKQWTVGLVWSPVRQFNAEVDYFRINLDNIINTPSAQEVVSGYRSGDPAYANTVILTPEGDIDLISTQTVNSGGAKVRGFDVLLNYRDTFSWGDLGLSMQGTYYTKFDETSAGGTLFHKIGTIVDPDGNPVIRAEDGGVVPRWKHVIVASWGYKGWGVGVTQNFYDGYETGRRQIDGERNFVGDQSIFDVILSYTGIKNLRLALGVKNVFDKDPPLFVPVSNQFQAGYDVTMYDPRSRYVYGTIGYKFW